MVPLIYGGPIRVGSILAGTSIKSEEYGISSTAATAIGGQTGVLLFGRTG